MKQIKLNACDHLRQRIEHCTKVHRKNSQNVLAMAYWDLERATAEFKLQKLICHIQQRYGA